MSTKILGKSWRTSMGGILLALGAPMATAGEDWVSAIGTLCIVLGGLLMGRTARDDKVTSEKAGVAWWRPDE